MKKLKNQIAIILVSVFLGLILSIQYKTVENSQALGALPTQRAQDLANELKKVHDALAPQNPVGSKRNVVVFGAALIAVFGFYFALGGVWTFMAEIGHTGGIALELASRLT